MPPRVPKSTPSIYSGNVIFYWSPSLYSVLAAVTTIIVILIVFRNLCKIRNKSQEEGISRKRQFARNRRNRDISIPTRTSTPQQQPVDHSPGDECYMLVPSQVPLTTSEPQFVDKDARDEYLSILAQIFTPRPQPVDHSSRDEGYPGVPVRPRGSHTTSELQTVRDRDGPNSETARDSELEILITSPAINHSPLEARNEDCHGDPIQTEMPLVAPERSSIDVGGEDAQNTEAGHEVDPDVPIPTGAPTEPYSGVRRGGDMGRDPSMTLFDRSSNFQISNTNINAICGNATIIRFGDGQFTEIQRNLICDYIANLTVLPDINNNLKKHVLIQSIISLPRAEAVFNDYQTKKKSGPCFEGTRVALLREMADWATGPDESRMYILSGLAGIGKSTVAYTIASRAADLKLLGASFFFSRDEADRNNAKKFFTTIAYQLCVYNATFAKAIGDVLLTECGSAATTKDPQEQLQVLIVEPLRSIVQSRSWPILIVVDALDECDKEDGLCVLTGLRQLVRVLPSFKVILTTRPKPYLDHFLYSQVGLRTFHLQNIEDKIVDGDIRLYIQHCLSLEEVQKSYPRRQWCASDEGIDSLVHAAGRLFIVASTAVRYVFDTSVSNPATQMQKLLSAFAQASTPFKDLDHFYTVILRNVVPANCDDEDIVNRYRSVVGTIICVQRPLSVSTLAHLINIGADDVHAVLDHLQSVILLDGDDELRIYHQSFSDYLTNQTRCRDPRLQIDPRIRHIQIGRRCFEIMDKHLKRNILGLGDPARFMSNEDGFKEDGITDEQLKEKIPQQLRYSCVHWVNHLQVANIENAGLMNGLEKFADGHMLYWVEVLSLIGELDVAHRAIDVTLKQLKLLASTSSDLLQLFSDALRFISKFYETIKRSALHTYYSALPFTPTNSLLHRRYIKEAEDNICAIEGGPEKWDALVATLRHGELVNIIKFSLASALFVSCSQSKLKIWDAATGTPISTVPGDKFAVADDFSIIASSEDKTITFYNVNGSAKGTMFYTPSKIEKLALSSESSRVAAALSDGTVWLWDSGNAELIDFFGGFEAATEDQLEFSPTGTRLAYSSANGIKLRDGTTGSFIADLQCGSAPASHKLFRFSGDGSRIASVSYNDMDDADDADYTDNSLTLWNSESGGVIDTITVLGQRFAISASGSLLATADPLGDRVTLWREKSRDLEQINVLKLRSPESMAFLPDNILIITTCFGVKLYNTKTHSFIHTLPLGGRPAALAFSVDCTRLAIGDRGGNVSLWNIRGIDASGPLSDKNAAAVTALALSRDCSRLACGFGDGTVELWGTSPPIGPVRLTVRSKMETIFIRIFRQSRHAELVLALGFGPDCRLLASTSSDGTIKLWNGGDGTLRGTVNAPTRCLQTVALSNSVLVATCGVWEISNKRIQLMGGVSLWRLDTLDHIHTFWLKRPNDGVFSVSIAENSAIIAVFRSGCDGDVALLDAVNRTAIATFDVPDMKVRTMTFLRDNSNLIVQSNDGDFLSFNLINYHIIKGPSLEHLIQLPNIPLWHGVPIWHCQDKDSEQHYIAALFSQHKSPVPILWIPSETPVTAWAQGSSVIALGCGNGRVILLRLPTSHVS